MTSRDAYATVKENYENEINNNQLKSSSQSAQETYGLDASIKHDSSMFQTFINDDDIMKIEPDKRYLFGLILQEI